MFRYLMVCSLALVPAATLRGEEAVPTPRDVPPVVATAVASGDGEVLQVHLTCPRAQWRKVGKVVPQSEWPELKVKVEQVTRTLALGGPSALAESRVVDVHGNDFRSDEILQRLETETPVLVSVSGKMVDPYYLQTTKPDTLIILLGPRDGVPAPAMLPSAAARPTPASVVPAVFDDRPRWRSVLLRGERHRPRGRLREALGIGDG